MITIVLSSAGTRVTNIRGDRLSSLRKIPVIVRTSAWIDGGATMMLDQKYAARIDKRSSRFTTALGHSSAMSAADTTLIYTPARQLWNALE